MAKLKLTNLDSRFSKLEAIHSGGMGHIARAHDPILDREVAIKRLLPDLEKDPASVRRFLSEAKAIGKLEHPGIPPIYELGTDGHGNPFFAQRLIVGQDLAKIIEQMKLGDHDLHQRFRFQRRLEVFIQVCEAIAFAHDRGQLHADIKPENIMLGQWGEVFLVDWGLSQVASSRLDSASSVLGTPAYMAPEIVRGEPHSTASEVYALGATLYEWLALTPAQPETNLGRLLADILHKEPVDACSHYHLSQGRVPAEMRNVIVKCMHKEIAQRPTSVHELIQELRLCLDGEFCPVCPHTAVKSGLNRLSRWIDNHPSLGLMFLFILVALGALGWLGFLVMALGN